MWQILCRWCKIVLEEYRREEFPASVPLVLLLKIAFHSLSCPELQKRKTDKQGGSHGEAP